MAKAGRKTSVGKHIRDIIMDAHDKGASVRDIEKYLNEELDTRISKTTIQRIISSWDLLYHYFTILVGSSVS